MENTMSGMLDTVTSTMPTGGMPSFGGGKPNDGGHGAPPKEVCEDDGHGGGPKPGHGGGDHDGGNPFEVTKLVKFDGSISYDEKNYHEKSEYEYKSHQEDRGSETHKYASHSESDDCGRC